MHELSLAKEIVRLVSSELSKRGNPRLLAVRLRIGRLAAVDPEALSFSFQSIIEDTELAGVRLVIEDVPIRGRCRDCGKEFEIKEGMSFTCPDCSSASCELISGQEFDLISIEVEGKDEGKTAG